jgi:hypothetical protein
MGVASVFGAIGGIITANRNRGVLPGFLLGFFLNVLGLVIAVVLAPIPGRPLVPAGMTAVRCQRCNADQNIPTGAPSAECWQCKTELAATMPAPATSTRPITLTKDAPTLAAARHLFPDGKLPCPIRVQVIKVGDPNFGKFGTVDLYEEDLACVRFSYLGKTTLYKLDELQTTDRHGVAGQPQHQIPREF